MVTVYFNLKSILDKKKISKFCQENIPVLSVIFFLIWLKVKQLSHRLAL